MSNNIGRTTVAPTQNGKVATINDSDGRIDAALTEVLVSDYTSADVTLTDAEYEQAVTFETDNLSVARALNVPQIKKLFIVDNTTGSATVTVTRGSGTIAVPLASKRLCYTNGTANGIIDVGGAGGGVFLDHTDTPGSFSGQGSKLLAVNAGATAVEFVSGPAQNNLAGMQLVETRVISAAASADFTDLLTVPGESLILVVDNFQPSTDDVQPQLTVSDDNGSTFKATSHRWTNDVTSTSGTTLQDENASDTEISLTPDDAAFGVGNASGENLSLTIELGDLSAADKVKVFSWQGSYVAPSGQMVKLVGAGGWDGGIGALDAVRLAVSSGTFDAVVSIYKRTLLTAFPIGGFNIAKPGALVHLTSNFVLPAATDTIIPWDAAVFDNTFDPQDGGPVQRFWLGVNIDFVDGDVTTGTDVVAETGHGFLTGEGPVRLVSSGTLPAGLSLATDFWIIRVDDNNLAFATSRVNALADTRVDITAAAGGGTHTIETETKFVIPAGVGKISITSQQMSDDTGNNDSANIVNWIVKNFDNGGSSQQRTAGLPSNRSDTANKFNDQMNLASADIEVSEGDVFELHAFATSTIDLGATVNDRSSWFAISVEEGTATAAEVVTGTMHVRDEKTSGTAGGTATAGSYETRTLNAVVTNTVTGASLATNQVTLPAGTYDVEASAPGLAVVLHKIKLRDTTGAADLVIGTAARADVTANNTSLSLLKGRFTLGVESVLELQHRVSTTNATFGHGAASGFGEVEVYADLEFKKIVTV